MAGDTDIPIDYLRQALDLDVEAGVLRWRERPREHFGTAKAWATFNTQFAGTVAGSLHGSGYVSVKLTVAGQERSLKAHRIVFAMTHGYWPPDQIDHENGVRVENGVANLREATHGENGQNRKTQRNNTSGYPGVSRRKWTRKWQASIRAGGRLRHLGWFDDPEEAFMAVCDAKARLHKFQPEFRDMTEAQAAVAAYAWFRRRAWREIV